MLVKFQHDLIISLKVMYLYVRKLVEPIQTFFRFELIDLVHELFVRRSKCLNKFKKKSF